MKRQRSFTNIRRIKRPKTSSDGVEISTDLIYEILSRLPVKSIARCRCVSKPWATILSRPDFTESFLTRSYARPQLLFTCKKNNELFFFSSPQLQSQDINSPPLETNQLIRFPFDGYQCEVVGPVHGLLCLIDRRIVKGDPEKETVPVICNPSTGQFLHLPKVETSKFGEKIYFGYNPVENQYKVLSMTWPSHGGNMHKEHQILTLGTGNLSWKPIACRIPHNIRHKGICINGVLYYKAFENSSRNYRIICFDFRSEKFSFINAVGTFNSVVSYGTLVNYNEKLGLLLSSTPPYVSGSSKSIELWVLEDVEKQEWSERKYVLPALWQNLVGNMLLRFAGVNRSKEIGLWPSEQAVPFYVFYYDTDRNKIRRVEIKGMEASKKAICIDHIENLNLKIMQV